MIQVEAFINEKKALQKTMLFLSLRVFSVQGKQKTEKSRQSFVELVVCDLQVLNYGFSPSLPLQAF